MILLDGSTSRSTTCSPSPTTAPRSASRPRRARASPRRAPWSMPWPPAMPRSTASTPASAISPRRASTRRISRRCSSTCCAATPPASTRRCRSRAVRAAMALRANVLAKGFSGIRVETLEALLALLNRGVHPRVPSRGSVGASGDLAPLAHLALVLIGEGETWDGPRRDGGAGARRRPGSTPVTLGAEGRPRADQRHAGLHRGAGAGAGRRRAAGARRRRHRGAVDRRAARLAASVRAAHPRAASVRRDRRPPPTTCCGCSTAARINASHANCGRVQDAYSMRCAPQVHGAAREALDLDPPHRRRSR